METDTETRVARLVDSPPFGYWAGRGRPHRMELASVSPTSPPVVAHLSREDLQAIVQEAYDQHGILAEPSYQLEATRTTGLCPCGQPACSDGGQS